MNEPTSNDYDLVPYDSYSFPQSSPEHLYCVAKVFGLSPVDFKKCRVLELGCASGGNILPLAELYPYSEFVGVDYSGRQIDEGQAAIKAIGLENVCLHEKSIADIDEAFGKFDYIIAHGVYSWVPEAIRDATLRVCKDNLSEAGIAYVSYNTLPGWNMLKSVRDMMTFHTRDIEDPKAKIAQAKAIVKFVAENVHNSNSPYSALLKSELERVRAASDHYLYHEYLEAENEPSYFYQFMDKAQSNGLQYLGDTDLHTMLLDNHSKQVSQALKEVQDIVHTEQYMDFLNERRFRRSLLCHNDKSIQRGLRSERASDFHFLASMSYVDVNDRDKLLLENEQIEFVTPVGNVKLDNKLAKMALGLMIERNGQPISLNGIAEQLAEHFPEFTQQELVNELMAQLVPLQLVFKGVLTLRASEGVYTQELSEKPCATRFAQYQARTTGWVTNARHECLNMDPASRMLVGCLDGKRELDEIVQYMVARVNAGELILHNRETKEPIQDAQLIQSTVEKMVKETLPLLAQQALLIG